MMRTPVLASMALAAGLTACATAAPPPPPLLQYASQGCATAPDLAAAISLTPPRERAEHVVSTVVNGETPCLVREGGATPYIVYALPADRDDKTLSVGGLMEQVRVFSPEVALLDAGGRVTRTFAPDEYFYRGPVYSVQFRPREGEAYVLVTSDAERVGVGYSSIVTGMQTTTVATPMVIVSINSGTEAGQNRTFSYEGTVQVSVFDSDTDEGR